MLRLNSTSQYLGPVTTICMSLCRKPCFVQTRRRERTVAMRTATTGNAVWRNRDPALRVVVKKDSCCVVNRQGSPLPSRFTPCLIPFWSTTQRMEIVVTGPSLPQNIHSYQKFCWTINRQIAFLKIYLISGKNSLQFSMHS